MASPVDWEAHLKSIQHMYATMENEASSMSDWDRAHCVQEVWGGFEECYRKHLLACHDISDAERTRDTVTRMGALQPIGSKNTRTQSHGRTQLSDDARLHQHLHRFVALCAKETSRCAQRIRRDLHFICDELQISANELDHWLQAPNDGAEAFQVALDKVYPINARRASKTMRSQNGNADTWTENGTPPNISMRGSAAKR
eukprot:5348645-Amphidinium_carterae.2